MRLSLAVAALFACAHPIRPSTPEAEPQAARAPSRIEPPADAGPVVAHHGNITTTTTEEDGRTVITMTGPAHIFCQARSTDVQVLDCTFRRATCDGECIETTAMACFGESERLTAERRTHCFDRIGDCEGVRFRVAQSLDFKADPFCTITRLRREIHE